MAAVGRDAAATKADVNFIVGKMSFDINKGYQAALTLKDWLDQNYPAAAQGSPDPLIAAFGYVAAEAAVIRAAIDDAAYQALAAYGSSVPLKKVRGFGV